MTRAMLAGLAGIWLAAAAARAAEAGANPKQRAEALVATAREHVATEEYAAAAAAYAEALERYPGWNDTRAGASRTPGTGHGSARDRRGPIFGSP